MLSAADRNHLLTAAARARRQAYAPYSRFRVGAAVLTGSGHLFSGCNVENASYGLTVCAERTAILKAVSEGHRTITALALCLDGGGSPCGACRQVMREFGSDLSVLIGDGEGKLISETTLDFLLPNAFGPENLKP